MSAEEGTLRPRKAGQQFAAEAAMSTSQRLAALLDEDSDGFLEEGDAIPEVERLGDKSAAVEAAKEQRRVEREKKREAAKAQREAAREAAKEAKKSQPPKTQAPRVDPTQRTLDAPRSGTQLDIEAALAALHKAEDEEEDNFDYEKFLAAERAAADEDDEDTVFDLNRALGITPAAPASNGNGNGSAIVGRAVGGDSGLEAVLQEVAAEAAAPASPASQPAAAPSAPASGKSAKPAPKRTKFSPGKTAATKTEEVKTEVKEEPMAAETLAALNPTPPEAPPAATQRGFAVKQEETPEAKIAAGVGATQAKAAAGQRAAAQPVLLENDRLEMYWLDAREQSHLSVTDAGAVILFGRAKASDGSWRSCCLRVRGMQRCVMIAPRPGAGPMDVMKEVTELCKARDIGERRFKPVKRWYAFEEEDVPRDCTDWIKLRYPARCPPLVDTFDEEPRLKHVAKLFGASRSLIELFLVKRKLKGPCHITADKCTVVPPHARLSNCDLELTVDDPKFVAPKPNAPPAPLLTAMSVQLHAQLDPVKNVNEIFGISVSFLRVNPDASTRTLEGSETVSAFRPPPHTIIPYDFPKLAAAAGLPTVKTFGNETALLNWFVQQVRAHDPDMLVGHNFLAFTLDVLLHRFAACNIADWSILGRLVLRRMPKLQSGAGGTREATYQEREVCVGRLILDTYMLAREHFRTTNYKLIALARELRLTGLYSDVATGSTEEQPDIGSKAVFTAEALLEGAQHCINLSLLALALANRLDLVPLTKGLCSLAGNLWARVMAGSRSERIEYLLLHAFHAAKFVTPDRRPPGVSAASAKGRNDKRGRHDDDEDQQQRHAADAAIEAAEGAAADHAGGDDVQDAGGDATVATATKRKAKYQGGMVLEPKTGLYKEYILLLDFNSLYPSIIQEFDICFTTIKRREGEVPAIPSGDDLVCPTCREGTACPPPGTPCAHRCVLPKVIAGLVNSRRQVKRMMKTETDPNMLSQLEIRQKALKLTANSMYGCLGFEFSRFYAQALAELVTEKGREALQRACELVEGFQLPDGTRLEVVYGDTDSVMIRTQQQDLARVRELADVIRREVNKKYTKLEIGIDGVFCSMLLHKKKKYAALTVEDFMGEGKELKREVKGLDMVRRDWCLLTKIACSRILDKLLDHTIAVEDAVEMIVATMTEMANNVRGGKTYELPAFAVSKSLTRDPELYKDKNQPHVQVALRMKTRNEQVRSGDIIPYIVCNEPIDADDTPQDAAGPAGVGSRLASRAYHIDEVRRNDKLTIDTDWYLATQILPPVVRICEHVQGFSVEHLADAMGVASHVPAHLTTRNTATAGGDAADTGAALTAATYTSSAFKGQTLEDAFPQAEPFFVYCQRCRTNVRLQPHEEVRRLTDMTEEELRALDNIPSVYQGPRHRFRVFLYRCPSCRVRLPLPQITTQLACTLHRYRRDFYTSGGTSQALERVRQQLTYLRALFDKPREINGLETEAHENVLRLVNPFAPNAKVMFHALCDIPRLSEATAEVLENEPLDLVNEAYQQMFGTLVDCGALFPSRR